MERDVVTELRAVVYAAVPHEQNNDVQKLVTIFLLGTWSIVTIGISFGWAVSTPAYAALSVLVWTRFGKVQEQEAGRLEDEK